MNLPRTMKRALLASNDFFLLLLAVWLAFSLRWGRLYWPDSWQLFGVLVGAPCVGCFFLYCLGLYRIATRFIRGQDAARMYLALGLAVSTWALLVLMVVGTSNPGLIVPRLVVLFYGALACALVRSSRWVAAWMLKDAAPPRARDGDRRPIVIYGAGPAGVRLLEALRASAEYAPIAFIDEVPSLIGQRVSGLKVYREEKIGFLVQRKGVKDVFLALPERGRRELQAIVGRLTASSLRVKVMPAIEDIAAGRVSVTDLRPIKGSDLLGRDPVPAHASLLVRGIKGKCVMITGAGGSIGAELTGQILCRQPRCLVLFEHSEAALYAIQTQIVDQAEHAEGGRRVEIVAVLGTVLDAALLERTMRRHRVQTVFHVAAYKHVAMVESNAVAGLRNNAFGTAILAKAALRHAVERIILISTDKAVRPTSIMGASKRLAELIFQAHAALPDSNTIFAIVRFGNVLDSSGSVVRRFRTQIEKGGPVTVTDRNVSRYFMSIPEAAALVIQAGGMARGGEVFVLDMGERVRIDDLARNMIRLMGRTVQDETRPDGDIAIRYTGLRPGEKRHEELNIADRTSETEHPAIRRNDEPFLDMADLGKELAKLEEALRDGGMDVIQATLARSVEGYRPAQRSTCAPTTDASAGAWRTVH